MSAETTETLAAYAAHPGVDEVLVANLPPGSVLTVTYPDDRVREFRASLPDEPLIVAIPGDVDALGWGVYVARYAATRQIRNGHSRVDREVWHDAERAIRSGGIAYVRHEQREYYGKSRWTAVEVRQEAGQ